MVAVAVPVVRPNEARSVGVARLDEYCSWLVVLMPL